MFSAPLDLFQCSEFFVTSLRRRQVFANRVLSAVVRDEMRQRHFFFFGLSFRKCFSMLIELSLLQHLRCGCPYLASCSTLPVPLSRLFPGLRYSLIFPTKDSVMLPGKSQIGASQDASVKVLPAALQGHWWVLRKFRRACKFLRCSSGQNAVSLNLCVFYLKPAAEHLNQRWANLFDW